MSAKTMLYAFAVIALAAVWSATALPLVENDVTSPANLKENFDIETTSQEAVQNQEPEHQQTKGTDASVLQTDVTNSSPGKQQSSETEEVTVGSAIPVVATGTTLPEVSNAKAESEVPTAAVAVEQTAGNADDGDWPSTDDETNSHILRPIKSDAKPEPTLPPNSKTPMPDFMANTHAVKLGQNIPFFLEFFQPFQSFQTFPPFQPLQPFSSNHGPQPSRNQPIPFGTPIDPFANVQPFNQMVESYTTDFRKMMESFDKLGLPPLESVGVPPKDPTKPVRKTTSKTEIIDGHRVQINETTVSGGDVNNRSFYHFKEIQVLPDETEQNMSNEELTSITNDDLETRKLETNEVKPIPSVTMQKYDDRKNFVKKVE